MKQLLTVITLFLISLSVFSQKRDVSSQAKKPWVKGSQPTIMVVPSDNWCITQGYFNEYEIYGTISKVPNYRQALQESSDLLVVISKINELMYSRGFSIKNLESSLKTLETVTFEKAMKMNRGGRLISESPIDALKKVAQADIWIHVTWSIISVGHGKYITFNLQGLDAYSDKQVAGAYGTGDKSFEAELPVLLEVALLGERCLYTEVGDFGTSESDIEVIENYDDLHLTIYDRWGTLVHEDFHYKNQKQWHGFDSEDGTYYYTLLLPNGFVHSGTVNISRSLLNQIDGFNTQLRHHFDDLFANGREIVVDMKTWDTWDYDFESEAFGNDELSYLIQDWVSENSVYSVPMFKDQESLAFYIRIPLFNDKGREIDAMRWGKELQKHLSGDLDLEIISKVSTRGLGEVTLILGSAPPLTDIHLSELQLWLQSNWFDSYHSSELSLTQEQKSIVAPPNLIASISFSEPSGNNYLDALEKGYFEIEINNTGQGPAKGISITVSPNKTDELNYNNTYIEEIPAGQITNVKIPIEAYLEVASGTHDFTFHFEEVNGFSPQDVQIQFPTKEYQLPDFYVVDFQMNEPEISKNGNIDASEIIDLNIRIGNKGIGTGKGVFVKFTLGDNVFIANTPTQVNIGTLEFNETIDIPLSFFVNNECSEQIPIYIYIADETNLVIVKNQRIELFKSSNIASVKKTVIKGIDVNTELTIKGLNSLVDKNIPTNNKVNNRFALVIGNEDYKSKQSTLSSEQNVDYAINDAAIFKKYCLSALGVKEKNMYSIMNATAGQMSQKIDLLTKILSKLDSASELIVYYAGHGYPDELTKVPYLIPVDVSASNLSSAIKLDDLYQKLANTNASKITIFLDACFTGGGRNSGLVASRGVKVKPKQGSLNGNIVVFSASSEDQSSLPYHDEGHGIFTYFLLKKIQETKGNVTLGELSDYLEKNVSIQSLRVNQKEQDPTVNTSQKVINDWRNWRFGH